jgi:hypothetical protein
MLGYANPECDRLNPKAVQLTDTDAGAIYDYNETTKEFGLRSTYGMDDELIAAFKERAKRPRFWTILNSIYARARRRPV